MPGYGELGHSFPQLFPPRVAVRRPFIGQRDRIRLVLRQQAVALACRRRGICRAGPQSVSSGKSSSLLGRRGARLGCKIRGKRYVIELKVPSQERKDRAVPLISRAILEVQLAARRFPRVAIPVAVLAADHISHSVPEQVKRFALQNAPDVGIGIIDAGGFRSFAGHGLESLNAERSESPAVAWLAKRPSSANLFLT